MDQIVADLTPDHLLERTISFRDTSARRPRLRIRLRSALLAAGAVIVLGAAGVYAHDWWTTGRFLVSTDDAYRPGRQS